MCTEAVMLRIFFICYLKCHVRVDVIRRQRKLSFGWMHAILGPLVMEFGSVHSMRWKPEDYKKDIKP